MLLRSLSSIVASRIYALLSGVRGQANLGNARIFTGFGTTTPPLAPQSGALNGFSLPDHTIEKDQRVFDEHFLCNLSSCQHFEVMHFCQRECAEWSYQSYQKSVRNVHMSKLAQTYSASFSSLNKVTL